MEASYPIQPHYKGYASTLHYSAFDSFINSNKISMQLLPVHPAVLKFYSNHLDFLLSRNPPQFPLFSVQSLRWNLVQTERTLICSTCSPVSLRPRTNGKKTCAKDHLQWKNKSCKRFCGFCCTGEWCPAALSLSDRCFLSCLLG